MCVPILRSIGTKLMNLQNMQKSYLFRIFYLTSRHNGWILLIGISTSKVHSVGPVNVCTNFEIKWYKTDEITKHAKIVSFSYLLFDVTSQRLDTSDRYFDQERFETNQNSLRFKSYKLRQWFSCF